MLYETGIRQKDGEPFSLSFEQNDSVLKKLNHTKPLNIDGNKNQGKSEPHVPEIDHGNLGIIQNPQNKVRNIVGTLGLERQDGRNEEGNWERKVTWIV